MTLPALEKLNYSQLDVYYPEGVPDNGEDKLGGFDAHLALSVLGDSLGTEVTRFPKCPLKSASAQVQDGASLTVCPVGSCMYNHPQTTGSMPISLTNTKKVRVCKWHDMVNVAPSEWLEENGKLKEAEKAAQRVRAFLYTDRYVQYAIGRTLLDTAALSDPALREEETYNEWPFARGEKGWAVIQKVLRMQNPSISVNFVR